MKILTTIAISIGLLTASQAMEKPSFHTKGTPTGKPTGALKPGEYWWHPEISPQGAFMILVSVPEQTMHVYRNGVLIGRSTVSTGSKAMPRPAVCSVFSRKNRRTALKRITMRRCLTCSGSLGAVSPCTQANYADIPPAKGALG